jgi:hypothetical protein
MKYTGTPANMNPNDVVIWVRRSNDTRKREGTTNLVLPGLPVEPLVQASTKGIGPPNSMVDEQIEWK